MHQFLEYHELLAWLIRLAMVPVVLKRRRTTGAATAWLLVIFFYPYVGVALYLLFGTTRLGRRRAAVQRALAAERCEARRLTDHPAARAIADNPAAAIDPRYEPLVRQAEKISGFPVLAGNAFEFVTDSVRSMAGLIADIDAAADHVHLLFYIYAPDATGRRVADALLRAAARGVRCRLLVDALGSRVFFRSGGMAERLKKGGVEVVAAMRVFGVAFLPRVDLRNHRKLAVIDAHLAWTGSQNVVDANYGGRAGGPWFDLLARVTGPVVAELQTIFVEDWQLETRQVLTDGKILCVPDAIDGGAPAQVVATGPTEIVETFRRVVIAAVGAAQREIILTTPYFLPDEPTVLSLLMAIDRGVAVTLILPRRGDHVFTAAAGRSNYGPLLRAGARVLLFPSGLIHAKTLTIDGRVGIFGSANIDPRSFNLNFELNVLVYGEVVTQQLREVQLRYAAVSDELLLEKYLSRPATVRLFDDVCGLLSPLL
jgi:cardiolipin synthase